MPSMPTLKRKLTPVQQLRILAVLRESFYRQLKKVRTEQYNIIAQMVQRIDREKTEQLLKDLNAHV